ncbi:MAG: hypothetical protein LBD95_03985, partial [Clostridiales Family XIII bacterium]|nr:hypothetical protein [Clostridiales Family XIII bacterium]
EEANTRLRLVPPVAPLTSLSVFPLRLKPRKKGNIGRQVPMRAYPHLRSKWPEGATRQLPGFSRLELTVMGEICVGFE